jgi:hypothetical protein
MGAIDHCAPVFIASLSICGSAVFQWKYFGPIVISRSDIRPTAVASEHQWVLQIRNPAQGCIHGLGRTFIQFWYWQPALADGSETAESCSDRKIGRRRAYLKQKIYTITINHRLSIYTTKNHSLLFLKLSRAHAQLFRHPVRH